MDILQTSSTDLFGGVTVKDAFHLLKIFVNFTDMCESRLLTAVTQKLLSNVGLLLLRLFADIQTRKMKR